MSDYDEIYPAEEIEDYLVAEIGLIKPTPISMNIDWEVVRNLFSIGCNAKDVCNIISVSYQSLSKYCLLDNKQSLKKFRKISNSCLKASLLKKQVEMAMQGNAIILRHLGKVHLGQTDQVETKSNLTIVNPIQVFLPSNGRETLEEIPKTLKLLDTQNIQG